MDRLKAHYAPQLEGMKSLGIQNPEKDFDAFCTTPSLCHDYELNKDLDIDKIDPSLLKEIDQFIKRRSMREPLERILNRAIFRGMEYEIAPHIFKPGFETETTIDHALEQIKNIQNPVILDCGTGSGCLLISLLLERPDATGIGIDIDDSILAIAKRNAETHKVFNRANFIVSDWGQDLDQKIDLIISNPPRIPSHLVHSLVKEVAIYDPFIALDGGKNGEVFYQRSAELLRDIGNPESVCVIQIGQVVIHKAVKVIKQIGYDNIQIGRSYKYTPNCIIFHNQNFKSRIDWKQNLKKIFKGRKN